MMPRTPRNDQHPALRRFPARRLVHNWTVILLGCVLLASCQQPRITSSREHFLRPTEPPVIFSSKAGIAKGKAGDAATNGDEEQRQTHEEVYTITVTQMPIRDLLFALARDANKNIDIYPGITGLVTLSAINQTLPQILDRVTKQVEGIRYSFEGTTIVVTPDRPHLKIYQIDYLNVKRKSESTNKVSTQLSTGLSGDVVTGVDTASNQSQTTLTNSVENKFWTSLEKNINAILEVDDGGSQFIIQAASMEGDELLGDGIGAFPPVGGNASSEIGNPRTVTPPGILTLNPEAGIATIIATALQHERIQDFLDTVMSSVHRQVLIESTVVEVALNDQHQEGVDWTEVFNQASGFKMTGMFSQNLAANLLPSANPLQLFSLQHFGGSTAKTDPTTNLEIKTASRGGINAVVQMLETYGNTKVLSSPKIMALNNQPAVLKVVKNRVFFTLKSGTASTPTSPDNSATAVVATTAVFDTQIHTVPEGLVMSVTPQISANGIVSLNVRPTITRISRWVDDPNPALQVNSLTTGITNPIHNRIPEMEIKEMETVMRVHSGQVAVMGGLMQDKFIKQTSGLPVISRLPGLGALFSQKVQGVTKSELVIFLRPVVITHGTPLYPPTQVAKSLQSPRASAKSKSMGTGRSDRGAPGYTPPVAPGGPALETAPVPDQGPDVAPSTTGAVSAPSGPYLDFTQPGAGGGAGAVSQRAAPRPATPYQTVSMPRLDPNPWASDTAGGARPGGMGSRLAAAGFPAAPPIPDQGTTTGPEQRAAARFFVELGSYQEPNYAHNVHQQVTAIGLPAVRESTTVGGQPYMRVRSGPYPSHQEATLALDRITSRTGIRARLASN